MQTYFVYIKYKKIYKQYVAISKSKTRENKFNTNIQYYNGQITKIIIFW